MTERERAVQRLRNAARRLGEANEKLTAAEAELVAAAAALDKLEDLPLPNFREMRGILGDGEYASASKEKP